MDVVFLNFAKTFDRVAHNILRKKLCNFGISGALFNFCKDYLTGQEQRVVIEEMNFTRRTSGILIGPFVLCTFH